MPTRCHLLAKEAAHHRHGAHIETDDTLHILYRKRHGIAKEIHPRIVYQHLHGIAHLGGPAQQLGRRLRLREVGNTECDALLSPIRLAEQPAACLLQALLRAAHQYHPILPTQQLASDGKPYARTASSDQCPV